jgi:hypothetical protein
MNGPAICECSIFAFGEEANIVLWNLQGFSKEHQDSER